MTAWTIFLGIAALLGVSAAVYCLHRFCLWLEERGLLFYLHRKPSSSPAACLAALQKAIEPQVEHVVVVKEARKHSKEEAPGQPAADPPQAPAENR